MYHIGLRAETKPGLNYSNITAPKEKETIQIPTDDSVPTAPDGFVFYRIVSGDTLVSLSVRFGISQNKIRRYNNKVCFGHRLTHIIGKLLLIPVDSTVNLTTEMREQLNQIYLEDNERTKIDENIDDKKYSEPDENGKYQLKKALMFHTKGMDEQRADYYLGEANWNVRKALNLWRSDDKWEKKRQVINACKLTDDEAVQLLDNYHWDVSEVIRFCKNEEKKMEKINKKLTKNEMNEGLLTKGSTEMQSMRKDNDDKAQNLADNEDDDEYINSNQGALSSGLCCSN